MGGIRDQLQTLTGAELLASQLSDAGGKAFVSVNAAATQRDLNEVVEFWRSIHVPTYGSPIAKSAVLVNSNVDANPVVLQVPDNEACMLQAMIITNNDASNASTVTLTLDAVIFFQQAVPPSTTIVAIGFQGIDPCSMQVVGGQQISINQSGATAAQVQYALTYCKTSQG